MIENKYKETYEKKSFSSEPKNCLQQKLQIN